MIARVLTFGLRCVLAWRYRRSLHYTWRLAWAAAAR